MDEIKYRCLKRDNKITLKNTEIINKKRKKSAQI